MKKYNVTVNGTVYEVEIEEVESFSGASSAPAAKAEAPKSAPAVKAAPAAKTEAPKSAPVSAPAAAGPSKKLPYGVPNRRRSTTTPISPPPTG